MGDSLHRQWSILRLIPRHPQRITLREICERLDGAGIESTKRTVERDLLALQQRFAIAVDDRSKPYGVCWMKDAAVMSLPTMSTAEALAFLLTERYLASLLTRQMREQLGPYFRVARQTIGGRKASDWLARVRLLTRQQPVPVPSVPGSVEAAVCEALLDSRQIEIRYRHRDQTSTRHVRVDPLGLVNREGIVHLVARDTGTGQVRPFRLHRMDAVEPTGRRASVPAGFNLDQWLASGGLGFGGDERVRLIARFHEGAGDYLAERPLPTGSLLENESPGVVRLEMDTVLNKQLRWWLLSFGADVEVLAPAQLREDIARAVQSATRRYQ